MNGTRKIWLRKIMEELGLAVGLLTRLPVPAFEKRTSADFASAFWAFPLIGFIVAGFGALVAIIVQFLSSNEAITILFATLAMIFVTGALHEDGLADFWDGVGGGRTPEHKLAIMRDSHIGTYGVIASIVALGLLVLLLTEIMTFGLPNLLASFFCVEAAARAALAIPLCTIPPARPDGLGASVDSLNPWPLAVGIGMSAIVSIGLLGVSGIALLIGAAAGSALITVIASNFLGGFTGDVLGAAVMTGRITGLCGALLAMTS